MEAVANTRTVFGSIQRTEFPNTVPMSMIHPQMPYPSAEKTQALRFRAFGLAADLRDIPESGLSSSGHSRRDAILHDSFEFHHVLRSPPHNAILTQLHMHCMLDFHQITHANPQSHSLTVSAPSSRPLLQFKDRIKRRGCSPARNHTTVPQAHSPNAYPLRYICTPPKECIAQQHMETAPFPRRLAS
jgi:hypothetical protein